MQYIKLQYLGNSGFRFVSTPFVVKNHIVSQYCFKWRFLEKFYLSKLSDVRLSCKYKGEVVLDSSNVDIVLGVNLRSLSNVMCVYFLSQDHIRPIYFCGIFNNYAYKHRVRSWFYSDKVLMYDNNLTAADLADIKMVEIWNQDRIAVELSN